VNMTKRASALFAGALALTMVAAACGSDSGSSDDTTAAPPATTAAPGPTTVPAATTAPPADATTAKPADLKATLNGSGATFPKSYYEEAIAEFQGMNKGVTINYPGGGSGKGRQDLADQVVDWAGSDSPINSSDVSKFKGGEVLYFPTVVAPITVSVNVDGGDGMHLDCPTIAGIFQKTITDWSDPAIAALNPDLKASGPITPAVRSDSSGTTDNFSKFLERACGKDAGGVWKLGTGSTIQWPAGVSAGNGNSGVAQIVKDTKGAIGYVDLSDAKASGLAFAAVKNKSGNFVEPTVEGASAAAAGVKVNDNLTFSAVWADGADAYPITSQTWILAYTKQTDKAKGEALKAFIAYILSEDGQKLAESVDFGSLPAELVQKATAQLDTLELPA
jgi:phosphate transport system substrate-binding protein